MKSKGYGFVSFVNKQVRWQLQLYFIDHAQGYDFHI